LHLQIVVFGFPNFKMNIYRSCY